jgi:hypothetical protein
VLDAEVVVLEVDVEVGVDQGVLDPLPDDAGHLVAVQLYDGAFYLDLRHGTVLSMGLSVGPDQSYKRCQSISTSRYFHPSAQTPAFVPQLAGVSLSPWLT